MRTIHKQTLAERDIKSIWLYSYKNWGEARADKYYDELSDAIESIVENPHIGSTCDHIRKGNRKLHVNRHIIFYRVTPEHIRIVRVLGEKMDFPRHFK